MIMFYSKRKSVLLLALLLITSAQAAYRAPVWSQNGMAATPHPEATSAAVEMLEQGGNAVDAVVAASFALAVVEPYHSGLGGGAFTLVKMVADDEVYALDARECAPLESSPDMYLDPTTGEKITKKSWRGGLAVGVPGSVAGRIALIERFGNLSLKDVIEPSRELAQTGFFVDRILNDRIKSKRDEIAEIKAAADVFLPDGQPVKRGDKIKQPILATTLKRIADDKGKSFYHGDMASYIVEACRKAGGLITERDLSEYRLEWRKPVRFDYRGYEIFSMPPPSSGGVCLAEILNILEGYPLDFVDQGRSDSYHLIASAFEHAFADRARWLGDPGFTPQPIDGMASEDYAKEVRKGVDRHRRIPVEEAGDPWHYGSGGNTSHISVIDANGNMCSMTTSVNTAFGSMVFVPELGFFLNSTMDDFATDEPNKYDLVGYEANCIEPGKRPLSSMSPTLVFKDGKPCMSIGSVGGPRIITSVAQILINVIDYGVDIQAAIDAPRIHMQWKPDKLYFEDEVPLEVIRELQLRGWNAVRDGHWSLSQSVVVDFEKGDFYGASDARGVGTADSPVKD